MKVALFSNKSYWTKYFGESKQCREFQFFDAKLNKETVQLAHGFDAVCLFVNDHLCAETVKKLKEGGTKLILMRCAGFNNVDLKTAKECGITILRVPKYSPFAVAEFAVSLMLTLNRKCHKSYNRVREGNFSLDGLIGFDMNGKTVGICGTGKIGEILSKILTGFGCKIIAYDIIENPECKKMGVKYVTLDEIWKQSDIISLHTPLLKETAHMINDQTISKMKDGVMLVNTSRGGLIDTKAVIRGLKSGKIGYLGIDVYENEADLFFDDNSSHIMMDDTLARLMTFPNVVISGHQAWFTEQALRAILETTVNNYEDFKAGKINPQNVVEFQASGQGAK